MVDKRRHDRNINLAQTIKPIETKTLMQKNLIHTYPFDQ